MKKQFFKKIAPYSIASVLLLLTIVVFADPMDDFIAELTEYRNELNRNYKKVVLSRSLYDLNRHFAFAAIDHKAVVKGLTEQLQNDFLRLQNIKAEFESLKIDLANHPQKLNELSARFFSLMGEVRSLQIRSKIIDQDIEQIAKSWIDYCNKERILLEQRRFDPLANFVPDGNLGYVSGPTLPYSVEVQVGFNSNGEMTDFRTEVNQEMNEQKEKEAAATYVVAGTVSNLCGPFYPACFAGIIALKALIDIGRMGEKLADIAKKEQKQNELRRQIYDIQYNSILSISSQVTTETEKICKNNFPQKTEWPKEVIKEYLQIIEHTSLQISDYVHVDLVDKKNELYNYLIEQYFPELSEKYLSTIRDYFADQNILKTRILEFVQKPIQSNFERLNKSESIVSKTFIQHKIWDDIIIADSLFREDEGFSFYEEATNSNSFPNLWHDLGPQILLEVSK